MARSVFKTGTGLSALLMAGFALIGTATPHAVNIAKRYIPDTRTKATLDDIAALVAALGATGTGGALIGVLSNRASIKPDADAVAYSPQWMGGMNRDEAEALVPPSDDYLA